MWPSPTAKNGMEISEQALILHEAQWLFRNFSSKGGASWTVLKSGRLLALLHNAVRIFFFKILFHCKKERYFFLHKYTHIKKVKEKWMNAYLFISKTESRAVISSRASGPKQKYYSTLGFEQHDTYWAGINPL